MTARLAEAILAALVLFGPRGSDCCAEALAARPAGSRSVSLEIAPSRFSREQPSKIHRNPKRKRGTASNWSSSLAHASGYDWRGPSGDVRRLPFVHASSVAHRHGPSIPGVDPLPPPSSQPESEQVFPALPPDPNRRDEPPLPPLHEELATHGGAHLYEPEGEQTYWLHQQLEHGGEAHGIDGHVEFHRPVLRLPEDWEKPRPLTFFQEFLGADPIRDWPHLHWFGETGFQWEPRFVGYGAYQLFGFAIEEGRQNQSGIGHQLLLDLDLRITGTERAHIQFRPLGEENTGGSFFQFSEPDGYVDNATGAPDRYWIEGEFYSIFQGWFGEEFTPRDYHFVLGRFPFVLHNGLLLNDDLVGFVVNKNTLLVGDLSNLNVQVFYILDDIDAFDVSSDLYGTHLTADYRHIFLEATLARLEHSRDSDRDTNYAALSATKFFGAFSVAGRALFKWGDTGGLGDGQLFVLETNWTRAFTGEFARGWDFEHAVFYANAFHATPGWTPIADGNFDRLRSTFEVDPLVAIARGDADDTSGIALGVQLFRHHEDESITPEVALEVPEGTPVWGAGIRYQRKTGARSFFEFRALGNWSDEKRFEREGVFVSETILF